MASQPARKSAATIPADVAQLHRIRDFVTQVAAAAGFNEADQMKIVMATDEALANIIEHGVNGIPGATVKIEVNFGPGEVTVVLADRGPRYDPMQRPDLNLPQHIKAGNKRGLGVFLIRKLVDEMDYRWSENGENVLRLVKRTSPAG